MKNLRYFLLGFGFLLLAACDRGEWNLPRTKPASGEAPPAAITDKDLKQIEAPRDGPAGAPSVNGK